MRTGSPFYTKTIRSRPTGEFDTRAIWNYCKRVHNATFVGPLAGPSEENMIQVDIKGWDEFTAGPEIIERLDPIVEKCRELNPKMVIVVEGATPTWSWPENPNCALVFAFCIRYNLPALYIIHKLNIPRISIVTDPKCYPRDSEMTTIWPNIMPAAVLSQENATWTKIIQGKRVQFNAVASGVEFWNTTYWHVPPTRELKDKVVATAANAHFKNTRLHKHRHQAWEDVWKNWLPEHKHETVVCGKGWDKHEFFDSDVFIGVVKTHQDAWRVMSRGHYGPVLPQKEGFNSTKPRLHALVNSVPLLYGDGGYMTYDKDERILPLNHPARIRTDGLEGVIKRCHNIKQEIIEEVLEKTTPDFKMLDDVIEFGPRPEFGGYKCLLT